MLLIVKKSENMSSSKTSRITDKITHQKNTKTLARNFIKMK